MRTFFIALVVASAVLARSTAFADDINTRYSAIARSPSTGNWGTAQHYATLSLARAAAETACRDSDCSWIVSGADDHPMALATTRNGAAVWNWGTSWPDLRDSLLADCRAYYGERAGCHIEVALPQ